MAEVNGTMKTDNAFWAERCTGIPIEAKHLKLKMGGVVEYFARATEDTTWCQMLQSSNKHLWQRDVLLDTGWVRPAYMGDPKANGGSKSRWPTSSAATLNQTLSTVDRRVFLSFWGWDGELLDPKQPNVKRGPKGGCCSTDFTDGRTNTGTSVYHSAIHLHRSLADCTMHHTNCTINVLNQ